MMSDDHPLFKAASALPAPIFAVIDGGKFDDPNFVLHTAGLSGMSLYLEGGDSGSRAAAGWLITLREERDLRAVIDIAARKNALVLWSWPHGQMTLYRHLRTLNLVEIPKENQEDDEDPAYETVLFRHWDPNVLGTLLPLLDGPQRARFLGAATGIAFDAADVGRLFAMPRPTSIPPPAPGMLRFNEAQMEAFVKRRDDDFHNRIIRYLRDAAPEYLDEHDETALYAIVRETIAAGDAIGLESEYSHGLWAYLHVITDGETTRSKEIRQHFYEAKDDPEKTLEVLIAEIQAELGQE